MSFPFNNFMGNGSDTVSAIDDVEIEKKPSSKVHASMPGLVAGFVRSFGTTLVFGALSLFKQTLIWWFRVPIKMFRPYSINPWFVVTQLAQNEGQPLTPKYLTKLVKKEGFRMLGLNVLPLMIANGLVGTVLFQGYNFFERSLNLSTSSYWHYFAAGAVSGGMQTVLSTPLDAISASLQKDQAMKFRHHGVHRAVHNIMALMPERPLDRIHLLYKNVKYNMAR
jgi:hypothetical protein